MGSPFIGLWARKTVVCIASGPSLTAEDCERVRQLPCIVTNTTFRLVPWAEALMGHDAKWWEAHGAEVQASEFQGRRVACAVTSRALNVTNALAFIPGRGFANAGTAAIALALHGGATRIVLLGFDCKRGHDGATHWHGSHPAPLGDAKSMPKWAAKFDKVAAVARSMSVPIINCTRDTALTCFPRSTLDHELAAQ